MNIAKAAKQISVIVPVYNTEKYLRECLDSILTQTFSDFELILIDDGSTDNSSKICDEYAEKDTRVRVYHQDNQGQAAARNFGVKESYTNWITFVDSDDLIQPQYLEFLYKNVNADIVVSCCGLTEAERFPGFENLQVPSHPTEYKVNEEFLMGEIANSSIGLITCAKIIKKEILQEYPFTAGRVFEDNAVVKKWLFAAGKISVIDDSLYFYRINYSGTSKGGFDAKRVDDVLWSRDEIINFYKEKGLQKAYVQAEIDYILFGVNLYFKLKKVDKENSEILKKKILERYEKDKTFITFSKENRRFIAELKHPRLMRFYWRLRSLFPYNGD